MLGTIGFKSYCVRCVIGIEPHEREVEQDLFIDLKVEIDFTCVAATDHLVDTVNYISLAAVCNDLARQGRYRLLEKYAADVIKHISEFSFVKAVWIRIEKPLAITQAECAFVELKYDT